MPKKRKPRKKRSGWPREREASPEQRAGHAIARIGSKLADNSLSPAEAERYRDRLGQILSAWEELNLIRPDTRELQEAIAELPEGERSAFLGLGGSQHRAHRGRAKVFARIFDADLIHDLEFGLNRAVERAGSPDDLGALGLALWLIRAELQGTVPRANNVLFVLLAELTLMELGELAETIQKLDATEAPVEGKEPPDEDELNRRRQQALLDNPRLQLEFQRRFVRQSKRLIRYVADGTVRAHLRAEEFGPLIEEIQEIVGTESATQPNGSSRALPRSDEVFEKAQAFAQDPANNAVFERFFAELDAQAQEARAAGLPVAERLAELAEFCHGIGRVPSIRAMVCEASFLRLQQEGRLGRGSADAQ